MTVMVAENVAVYEPPKQTRVVSLYWRLWKNVDPLVPSPLSGIPVPLLQRAIAILTRSNCAQIIGVADGDGVRFFAAIKQDNL
ncbi:hypothetical protein M405DRAFT_869489 [Rhizopogon salebrosus TDB-379]|nr:hypothetical protein M405DRAFT_869489 [Rhizopogon salebrosus TDB-379]